MFWFSLGASNMMNGDLDGTFKSMPGMRYNYWIQVRGWKNDFIFTIYDYNSNKNLGSFNAECQLSADALKALPRP